MQILLAFISGAVIGLAIHFLAPHRETRGAVVAPMIGAASAGLVWLLLTWVGVGIDTPWPWLSALVVPIIVTWPAITLLSRLRVAADTRRKASLRLS